MLYPSLFGAVTRRALAATLLVAATAMAQPAAQVDRMKTTTVPVKSVDGIPVAGELIKFRGLVKLQTRLVPDPDFNKPSLILFVEMKNIRAVGGGAGKPYTVSSQEEFTLPSAPNQNVELTFPFIPNESDPLSAAVTGVVQIAINVDDTGAITSAVATATVR
jgi:hypothetical protein